jgi:LysR family transcriptional regulator, glycine cleavage system transcriptional activator
VERLPLGSVRTFAVVARLLSITRAAEELNVTPSAVSHQVRVLEEFLGTPLFRREKNRIALTSAGQQYLAQASEGLLVLARATQTIKSAKGQHALRVAAHPSLAYLWLIDRLARFMKSHPDIPITVTAVPDPAPLMHGAFDIAFWYGSGNLPGLHVDPLV